MPGSIRATACDVDCLPWDLPISCSSAPKVEAGAGIRCRGGRVIPASLAHRGVAVRVLLPVPSGRNRDRAPWPIASCAGWRSSESLRRAAVPRATRSTAILDHSFVCGTPRLASPFRLDSLVPRLPRSFVAEDAASTAVAQSTSRSCTSPNRSWMCLRSFPQSLCSCGRKFSTMYRKRLIPMRSVCSATCDRVRMARVCSSRAQSSARVPSA